MVMKFTVYIGIFLFALALVGLLFAARVFAQETPKNCHPAKQIERQMTTRFNEEKVAVAATDNGKLIERWESPDGGWTLLLRIKRDVLCIITSGSNWRSVPRGQAVGTKS